MSAAWRFFPALAWAGFSSACSLFLPARRDLATEAKEKEFAVCPRDRLEYPKALFEPLSVVAVDEIYSSVRTGRSGNESRLQGARLRLRPEVAATPTALESLLICHQARLLLREPSEIEFRDDPYWLPGSWVDISVETDAGNFLVALKGGNIRDANQILTRARRWTQAQPQR